MTKPMNAVDLVIAKAKARGITPEMFCREIDMPSLPGCGWIFARAQFAGSGKLADDSVRNLRPSEVRVRCACGKAKVYHRSIIRTLSKPYRCASCARKAQWGTLI